MSLEDSINKLTVAVETLTKTITTLNVTPPAVVAPDAVPAVVAPDAVPAEVEPEAPKKSRKKAAAPVAEPEPVPADEPTPEPAPAPEPVAETVKITLQDIRELAQVALDNDKLSGVIAVNKKFGLRRISEATEDQYAEIHELLTKLTNGTS